MKIGIHSIVNYLPGETLNVSRYYTYLQPEFDKLPKAEKELLLDLAPETVHRLKDPSALEIQGLMAGQRAIDKSGLSPKDIDGLIVTQTGGKQFMPLIASYLQLNLGLDTGIIARNVDDGDVSLLSCLNLARLYVKSGQCKNVLVIGSAAIIGGKYGFGVDLTDPWCIQYGDGAAACIVSADEDDSYEILGYHFETEAVTCRLTGTLNGDYGPIRPPHNRDLCFAAEMDDKHGAYLLSHDEKLTEVAGKEGFITALLSAACEKAGLKLSDLAAVIPAHFAELDSIWKEELALAGLDPKIVCHLQKSVGHAGNADTLIDLAEFEKEGRFRSGDILALAAPCTGVQTAVVLLQKS